VSSITMQRRVAARSRRAAISGAQRIRPACETKALDDALITSAPVQQRFSQRRKRIVPHKASEGCAALPQCPRLSGTCENPWKTRLRTHWRMKLTLGWTMPLQVAETRASTAVVTLPAVRGIGDDAKFVWSAPRCFALSRETQCESSRVSIRRAAVVTSPTERSTLLRWWMVQNS
jgi:hypothetical protein